MDGLILSPGHLGPEAQRDLAAEIEAIIAQAPLFVPRMPRTGRAMSVRMTNCGSLGWVSDQARGYRYQPTHPETGLLWPPIPASLLTLWAQLVPDAAPPQACLVNFYGPGARMGMHVDSDEPAREAPVVSVSLGDAAVFRIGGLARSDLAHRLVLNSGDVLALTGPARRRHHGVDRVHCGTSNVWPGGGRINLTLRRVTPPE